VDNVSLKESSKYHALKNSDKNNYRDYTLGLLDMDQSFETDLNRFMSKNNANKKIPKIKKLGNVKPPLFRVTFKDPVNGNGTINGFENAPLAKPVPRLKKSTNGNHSTGKALKLKIEGLTTGNGFTNGNDFSNGLKLKMGNGNKLLSRSSIEERIKKVNNKGLVNGTGITNGNSFMNGNGLTNGNGITNGVRVRLINKAQQNNSLTKGNEVSKNGTINNGNGLTNGNGLSNGNGLTNGALKGRKIAQLRAKRRRLILYSTIIGIALISIPIVLYNVLWIETEPGIIIDGNFDDWNSVSGYTDSENDQLNNPAINIVEYKIDREYTTIYFYLKFQDDLDEWQRFQSLNYPNYNYDLVFIRIFVDIDNSLYSGYSLNQISAEYMIESSLKANGIISSKLKMFNPTYRIENGCTRAQNDWNAWETVYSLKASYNDNQFETQANIYDLRNGVKALFHVTDAYGIEDYSDAIVCQDTGALLVEQINTGPTVLTQNSLNNLMELKLTALGADIEIESLNFNYESFLFNRKGVPVQLPVRIKLDQVEYFLVKMYVDSVYNIGDLIVFNLQSVSLKKGTATINCEPTKAYVEEFPNDIRIDGIFNDWYDSNASNNIINDNENDVKEGLIDEKINQDWINSEKNIDILKYGMVKSTESISFYLEVKGEILSGTDVPLIEIHQTYSDNFPSTNVYGGTQVELPLPINTFDDSIYIFIDIDRNTQTGFKPTDWFPIGADSAIEIKGQNGKVISGCYMSFDGVGPTMFDWSKMYSMAVATDDSQMETQITINKLSISNGNIDVYFHLMNWYGNSDYSDNMINVQDKELRFIDVEDIQNARGVTTGAVINEIYPDDGANAAEWVEIYNNDQNLNGWYLYDTGGAVVYTWGSDPGTGYIVVNQADWGGSAKITEGMTLQLRDSSDVVQDAVIIASITDTSSYSRYKDYDGYPLDSATGSNTDSNDWYEENAGSITKGTANSTIIDEFESILLPLLIILLLIGLFNDKKFWKMIPKVKI
jgi:hypothetical protein